MFQIFIGPNGDDQNPGTMEKPLATLAAARDKIRQMKADRTFPPHGVAVQIRGGSYLLSEPFSLDERDSGTPTAPVVYQGYQSEKVRFIGGLRLAKPNRPTDPDIRRRLGREAAQRVVEVDLAAQGVTDLGEMRPVGFALPERPAPLELFFQGERMQPARWPNDGWFVTPQAGDFGRIPLPAERLRRWADAREIWVHGYLAEDWADYRLRVAAIDQGKGELQTESATRIEAGRRLYFFNILEELDRPGEYHLDPAQGKIWFWPPSDLSPADVHVSMIETIIAIDGATDVLFRGLDFEMCRGTAVVINNSARVFLQGAAIRNSGGYGVAIGNGAGCGVLDSEISDSGGGGIILDGGDRKTLTPGDNFAFNNHIHHYGRWVRTYKPAVLMTGVGNHAGHNLIHDAPHAAILFYGNEHLIDFNEIYGVGNETDDVGAIYTGRDWSMRGTVIRFNFLHDLASTAGGKAGVRGIYLDDGASGTTVFGNIFYKAGRSVFIGGGRDNLVKNNIFVEGAPAVHIDSRGVGWAKDKTVLGGEWGVHEKLYAVNYSRPPFSERYPSLKNIWFNNPLSPVGNSIVCNVFWGGTHFELDAEAEKHATVQNNIVKNPGMSVPGAGGGVRISDAIFKEQGCLVGIPYERVGRFRENARAQ